MRPLILMMLMAPRLALAEDKPLAIVVPPEIAGDVFKADELRQILTAHLGERLRERGYSVLNDTTLTAADQKCHERACLEGIPARYNVDLAVTARLESEEKTHNYRISVRMFGNAAGWKARDRLCVGCADFAARDMLGNTCVEMLGGTVTEAAAPSPAPAPVEAPKKTVSRWVYRGLALGFGVVGVLSLAQGFAEVAHNGDRGSEDGRGYHLDTTKGQAVFLTIGIASLVTTGVLAYLGWRAGAKRVALNATGVHF